MSFPALFKEEKKYLKNDWMQECKKPKIQENKVQENKNKKILKWNHSRMQKHKIAWMQ